MKTKLQRTEEALQIAILALNSITGTHDRLAVATLEEIQKTLEPPVEMIEEEVSAGWVNVYQHPDGRVVCGLYPASTKELADIEAQGCVPRIDCQEIRVKVQRTKKQVERSVAWSEVMVDAYSDAMVRVPVIHANKSLRNVTMTWMEDAPCE